MEESGSEGLDDCIIKESKDFLSDIDAVCISDNYWLGTKVREQAGRQVISDFLDVAQSQKPCLSQFFLVYCNGSY